MQLSPRYLLAFLFVGLLSLPCPQSLADWLPTGAGPYDYDAPANWAGGVVDGQWPAILTLTAAQSVTFDSNLGLGTGLSLLHDPTASGHDLRLLGDGTNRTITLGGDLAVNLVNNSASTVIGFGSTVGGQNLNVALGGDRVFYSSLARANGRGVVFVNDVSGAYDITKTGTGVIIFEGGTTFSGHLAVQAGEVNLSLNGTLAGVSNVTLGGTFAGGIVPTLSLDNRQGGQISGGNINVTNRLNDSATVIGIGNSRLHLRGHNSSTSSETVGTYVSQAGGNRVSAVTEGGTPNTTQPETTLTVTNLNRTTGSLVLLGGGAQNNQNTTYNDLGQGAGAGNARIFTTQINGAAPAAAMVNGIVPWALVADLSSTVAPSAFATYGANGFKPYGLDETGAVDGSQPYVATLLAAGAADNVRITVAEAISGTKTVNSLNTNVTVSRTAEGDTLQLTSGALLTRAVLTIQPRLDFAEQEGFVVATHQLVLERGLHNDGGNGVTLATAQRGEGDSIFLRGASTYTGPTHIAYGSVSVDVVNGIPSSSAVTVAHGGILSLRDGTTFVVGTTYKTDIGSIAGNGSITGRAHDGRTVILTTGGNHGTTEFAGVISNAASGTIGLDKVGSGTLTLSGANSYTAATTVSQGRLLVNGSITSDTTVKSGATLGGSGHVQAVTVESGGYLSPGNSPDQLFIAGNLLLASDSNYVVEIVTGDQLGNGIVGYDQAVVTGSVELDGAILQVTADLFGLKRGQELVIIDNDGGDGIVGGGTFAGLAEGAPVLVGGTAYFRISYVGGSGNDVVLTSLVPEPGSALLLGLALTGALVRRKRG